MIKDKEDITLDNETLDNLYQKLKPKFERFIDDVLSKVDPKLEGALWLFIASSLSNFRDMIENPEEKEVSWENPGVEGILTCDIDDNFKPIPLKKKINVSQDFIQVISNKISTNFLELKQIFLLRVLTQDLFFLVDEEGTTLNSRKYQIYLGNLTIEDGKTLNSIKEQIYLDNCTIEELDDLSIEPIIIPITGKIKRNNLEKNINLEFVIHPQPLTIDTVNKKAYFTVIKEFNYLDDTQEIINNPELWTDEEKKDFWEGLIKTFRDKGQKFYTNSKAFKKLPQREMGLNYTKLSIHAVKNILNPNKDGFKKYVTVKEFTETHGLKLAQEDIDKINSYGMELTDNQLKIMEGILKGFTETNYKGNSEPIYTKKLIEEKYPYKTPLAYKGFETLPVLKLSQMDIFRLSDIKDNSIAERERALQDFKILGSRQFCMFYERLYKEKGKSVKDDNGKRRKEQIEIVDTPITIKEVREDDKFKHYEVYPSVIFLDDIDGYFMLVPFKWREEIRKLFKRKASSYTFLFIYYLRDQFEQKRRKHLPYSITQDWKHTAKALKMPESLYIKKKKTSLTILENAYEVALKLNYLKSYDSTNEKHILILNEEKYYQPKMLKEN